MATSGRVHLTRLSEVRGLLIERDFHPSRALGQNFLVDGNILDILVEAADIRPGDRVLEVGPGLGVVTRALLERGAFVTAVEKDHRLFAFLQESLGGEERLELVEGDALELSVPLVRERSLDKLVSNLPYNPGSRILMDLICADPAPRTMTVTVQLEVAERLTAVPGSKAFGLMGLWSQLHYEVTQVKVISPGCFWPKPAVKSAIVHFQRRPSARLPAGVLPFFYELTRYAFQHRRKQLVSLLAKAPAPFRAEAGDSRRRLEASGAGAEARPEDLPLEVWCVFAQAAQAAAHVGPGSRVAAATP